MAALPPGEKEEEVKKMANRFLPGRYIVFGSVPVFQRGNGIFSTAALRVCEGGRPRRARPGTSTTAQPGVAWWWSAISRPIRLLIHTTVPTKQNQPHLTAAARRERARDRARTLGTRRCPRHATPPRDGTETASQAGSIAAESPTARQEHRGRLSSSRGSQSARLSQSVKTEAAAAAATTTRGGGGPAIECERRRDPCRAAIRDDGGGRRDGRGDGRRRPLGRRDPRRRRGPQPAHLPPAPTRRVPAPRPRHRRYVVPPSHSVCACATEIPCSLPPPEFW